MANHRKKCGNLETPPVASSTPAAPRVTLVQSIQQNKFDHEPADQSAIMYTTQDYSDGYDHQPARPVEKVNVTAMEILNANGSDHHQQFYQKPSKKRRHSPEPDPTNYETALSSFLIGCNLTFDIVDSMHFRKFMNTVKPSWNLPTSMQLKNRLLTKLHSMDHHEKKSKRSKKSRKYVDTTEESSDSD